MIRMKASTWVWSIWSAGRDPLLDIQERWSVDDMVQAMTYLDIEREFWKGLTPTK